MLRIRPRYGFDPGLHSSFHLVIRFFWKHLWRQTILQLVAWPAGCHQVARLIRAAEFCGPEMINRKLIFWEDVPAISASETIPMINQRSPFTSNLSPFLFWCHFFTTDT